MSDDTRPGRVLIVVQNLPVPFDRRVWLECQTLVAAGYGVSVICPKGPGDPAYQELDGVQLYKYRPAPMVSGVLGYALEFVWCWVLTALLSVRVLVGPGFDVMQACNPPDTYWALALPYKLLGKRFVFDQHDLCPEVYSSRFGGAASSLLLRGLHLLERATYCVADHVVSTNDSYRRVAMSRGRKSPQDVTVVRSGPDTSRMKPGPRRGPLTQGRAHLACYLGVMGPQDGVDGLLRSWSVLVHELGRRDCHLALLGFGDCYEALVEQAAALDLTEFVTFTGRADAHQIDAYLSTADVGLCPDPHSPLNDVSTMNKVMEYMAFGLPVVSVDLAESVVSAAGAAVYVPDDEPAAFARAVSDLLDDPDRRAALGTLARRRAVEVLDWRAQAGDYVRVFDRLCRVPERRLVLLPQAEAGSSFVAVEERRAASHVVQTVRAGLVPAQRAGSSADRRADARS